MTDQEYFDLLVLHIRYIEDRPRCKYCGKYLSFHSIYSGYTLEKISWQDKLERTNGGAFCSNRCQSCYQHEHPEEYPLSYLQGTGHGNIYISKKFNREFHLRSRLERWELEWAETESSVIDIQYESISIPFYNIDKEEICNYIPDFKITYNDGSIELVECKRRDHLELPINIIKFEAARKYCEDRGWKFSVYTEWDF